MKKEMESERREKKKKGSKGGNELKRKGIERRRKIN